MTVPSPCSRSARARSSRRRRMWRPSVSGALLRPQPVHVAGRERGRGGDRRRGESGVPEPALDVQADRAAMRLGGRRCPAQQRAERRREQVQRMLAVPRRAQPGGRDRARGRQPVERPQALGQQGARQLEHRLRERRVEGQRVRARGVVERELARAQQRLAAVLAHEPAAGALHAHEDVLAGPALDLARRAHDVLGDRANLGESQRPQRGGLQGAGEAPPGPLGVEPDERVADELAPVGEALRGADVVGRQPERHGPMPRARRPGSAGDPRVPRRRPRGTCGRRVRRDSGRPCGRTGGPR